MRGVLCTDSHSVGTASCEGPRCLHRTFTVWLIISPQPHSPTAPGTQQRSVFPGSGPPADRADQQNPGVTPAQGQGKEGFPGPPTGLNLTSPLSPNNCVLRHSWGATGCPSRGKKTFHGANVPRTPQGKEKLAGLQEAEGRAGVSLMVQGIRLSLGTSVPPLGVPVISWHLCLPWESSRSRTRCRGPASYGGP